MGMANVDEVYRKIICVHAVYGFGTNRKSSSSKSGINKSFHNVFLLLLTLKEYQKVKFTILHLKISVVNFRQKEIT